MVKMARNRLRRGAPSGLQKTKKEIDFCKMQSLGNDFMVVDAVTQKAVFSLEQIQLLADRRLGVGFDQLLIVEPPCDPDLDFYYRIFNADGSEVAQCANGACALTFFLHLKGLTNLRELQISTQSGRLFLTLLADNRARVTMQPPRFEPQCIPFQAHRREKRYNLQLQGDQVISCGVVSVGNPHCVILVEDCDATAVTLLGSQITEHTRFREKTNVGFMQIMTPHHIRLRVYERGVGETQACGSGACAAVAVGIDQGMLAKTVQVDLAGGTLQINWQGPNHPISLVSTARHVYGGTVCL